MKEIELMRRALHEAAAAADTLTDPEVLRVSEELDRLVVAAMIEREMRGSGADTRK